jgi:hypothetical protein
MGYCVGSCGNFYGLLCREWWKIFVGYCVASGGNLLWVIVWGVVVICYRLLRGK